ncbi:MAG: hypothetical protein GY870_11750 [archaeon]|nr:hypothetical protein [archaeon]
MKLPKELRDKKELGGAASKGKACSVKECSEPAIRSLAEKKWNKYLEKTKLKVEENKQHKIFLCKLHYKQVNKIRKSEEKIYQKKGFLDNKSAARKGQYLGE